MTPAEKDLPAMAASDRERLMATVTAELKNLKQLAAVVREQAVAEAARQHLAKLNDLGTALDSLDALRIVQLTGQSFRKMSAEEAAKLPK